MKGIFYRIYDILVPKFLKNKIKLYRWKEKENLRNVNNKVEILRYAERPIRVLFIMSSLPMWRAQGVYDLLKKDKRFNPQIIISPFRRFDPLEQAIISKEICTYLKNISIDTFILNDKDFDLNSYIEGFNPDIVFPCQPYSGIYGNQLDCIGEDRIMCYIPYGLNTIREEFAYNSRFHNLCWKVYQASELHRITARKLMANKAKNVKIVGEPDFDKFGSSRNDPWKIIEDGKIRKKIIWAPHFSIHSSDWLNRASFLWLNQEMVKIAKEYEDKIQVAFKPHPNLYSVLVKDWGKDETDQYYNQWNAVKNTQLEEGNFIDLFKYSDAMIHDCGSFTGEYMFVNKPVMFTTKDIEGIRKGADDFGLKCLDLHYIGRNIDDVRAFIELTVLKDKDYMHEARSDFYNDYLIPPNNTTVAMNIYNDLLDSFGFPKFEE